MGSKTNVLFVVERIADERRRRVAIRHALHEADAHRLAGRLDAQRKRQHGVPSMDESAL